ncbi:hypothetical protein niasHT_006521 [Heterodera trifolii]|uniref:Uncharacterized protein n=1 Tax=Heterodera trifolii TaxID=157864 RepID=A0ABD2LUA6_9BILA
MDLTPVGPSVAPLAFSSSSTDTSAIELPYAALNFGTPTEKLLLGGELIAVPSALLADEKIFRSVLCPKSFWSLSQASRDHLEHFLPIPSTSSTIKPSVSVARRNCGAPLDELLSCAFTSDPNFCFGNPLAKFFARIRNGYFSSPEQVQLRDHRRVLYDHYIRHYQMNLLKTLLINSHVLLEQSTMLNSLDEHVRLNPRTFCSLRKLAKHKEVRARAQLRAKRMIKDCRVRAGQVEADGCSSDDSAPADDVDDLAPVPPNARSTLYEPKLSSVDLDLYQPSRAKDVQTLYREYALLRETEPDCPSLDISDITLEEVYERAGISFQAERNFSRITEQMVKQKQQQQQQHQQMNTMQPQTMPPN